MCIGAASAVTAYDTYDESYDQVSCTAAPGDDQWEVGHACSNITDANWGTYGAPAAFNVSTVWINYTKPSSVVAAKWEYKGGIAGTTNVSVSAACFSQTKLQFRAVFDGAGGSVVWACYNGTAFATLATSVVASKAYEEAIWWGYTAVNGACDNSTKNACTTGTFTDIADSSSSYLWECVGAHTGTTDECSIMKMTTTLGSVGEGLGNFFDFVGNPLGVFIIIVGFAGGVIALFMAISHVIRKQ
jgi:hypothetical protein